MDFLTALGWVCSINSIIGAILVARLIKWGYVLWIAGNFIWIFLMYAHGIYEQIPVWVMLTFTSAYGFYYWGKNNKK